MASHTAPLVPIEQDPRWQQVLARDASADGRFWYSVATTGVYCRPSCPSRAARPENVTLHATLAQAQGTGARACRRCDPDAAYGDVRIDERIAQACRRIEQHATVPSLAELAAAAGLSPAHFHRLFRARTGVTPRAYAAALRVERVRDALTSEDSVTTAVHAAGYGSAGRFYAEAKAVLGMAPDRFRRDGDGETLRVACRPCTLGQVLVARGEGGIAAILLGDDADALIRDVVRRFSKARIVPGDVAELAAAVATIDGTAPAGTLPLDIRGTVFQRRVWEVLCAIPAGETRSYAQVAEAIGAPTAARAVAAACAANRHAVAIPCHRVVRGDGSLSGYRWGLERKRRLLAREGGN